MSLSTLEKGRWMVIALKGRIDSFRHEATTKEFAAEIRGCKKSVCLDLSRVDFLSLPTIHFFNEQARACSRKNMEFSVVGMNDKTRRHLEIFGDLNYIQLYTDFDELPDTSEPAASVI